ncbi:MAG TPA: lysophospholipid acyltransferase family protein [Actinophytocola sp.]|jgi:1-acyl-sn-glycerol-3-phosphate acyltransferase|uniref:lysophospholipid acyltransferase family protein n=1 Tax=Actinophytocola sp. TaxID=1872138 RepID=UPI002F92A6F3
MSGHTAEVIPLPRRALDGAVHRRPQAVPGPPAPVIELRPQRAERPGFLAGAASFLRHRLSGEYQVDEFGFDPELTDVLMPPLRAVYDKWFRVEVTGSLPAGTGALVVANHSGTLPWDALMTSIAVHDNHPEGRHLRMLGADLVFRLPVLASLARKTGTTLACSADAQRLLAAGEVVGVWPEGFKGIGKPFRDRYRLQRFGRGGFVVSALRAGVPIIPCSIVGAEEIYPKIADIRPLARLLGLPYFPVTPLFPVLGPLGAIPLPTKWTIDFGEPIRTDRAAPDADQDHGFVLEIADHVRETIQANLNRMVAARDSVFRG